MIFSIYSRNQSITIGSKKESAQTNIITTYLYSNLSGFSSVTFLVAIISPTNPRYVLPQPLYFRYR